MRFLSFLILIYIPLQTLAASPDFLDELKTVVCMNSLNKALDTKLKKQSWVPEPVSIPREHLINGIAFRDSREKKYFKIWSFKNQTTFLTGDLKTKSEKLTTWYSLKNCEPVVVERPSPKFPSVGDKGFTDLELDKLMEQHSWGVIYVWTPYMPLSVEGVKEVRAAVKAKGGELTILLDPKASLIEAKKWIGKGIVEADLTPAVADELNARQMALHYPIVFLYKDKFISNRTYVGFKFNKAYQKWIDFEMNELAKDLK